MGCQANPLRQIACRLSLAMPLTLFIRSHAKMCPDVPFVGWDVVLSSDKKCKICLLEVNLSCNFFRGSFDKDVYYDFIDESYKALSKNVKW